MKRDTGMVLPLHVAPRTLTALASEYDAWKTNAPDYADPIMEQAQEDAAEAFDQPTDDALLFVFDDRQRNDLESLVRAVLSGNEDDESAALERLREAWIDARIDDFAEAIEEQAASDADEEQI